MHENKHKNIFEKYMNQRKKYVKWKTSGQNTQKWTEVL